MTASQQASQAAKGNPATLENALKNIEGASQKPLMISSQALIAAITEAAGFGKKALTLELATGIALFAEADGVSRDSKQALQKIYVQAGYDAEDQFKSDYKTVRRRIDAAAALYEWLKSETIMEWIGNSKERKALMGIMKHLEQYDLRGINSVFALVGKPITLKRAETPKEPAKQPEGAPSPVANAIAASISEQRAERKHDERKTDVAGAVNFNTEHVQVSVAPNATRAELLQVVQELIQFASTLEIAEEKPAEKKELLAA